MNDRSRFEPPESLEGAPFWEATRDKEFRLPFCRSCDRAHWYPRVVCPYCHGTDLEWREASGRGTVYALSVQHRAGWPGLADSVPYVVALVDLDEGVRMLTGLVEVDPDEVGVGLPVSVGWEELSDGRHLPVFSPS